jgi:hypothetical protein
VEALLTKPFTLYIGWRTLSDVRILTISLCAALLIVVGCQDQKIARLEKQNQELKAEMEKSHATADYDLQAKCGKDARTWFDENSPREKTTKFLVFRNHYNKPMNKCYILVEHHYDLDDRLSWGNNIALWDVYENAKYANFIGATRIYTNPARTEESVIACESEDKKCKTIDEFNEIVTPYLND